jgi:hypothetical protein
MIIPRHDILYKLSIFQGLKEYKDDRFPDSIYYHKNGVIYFELEKDRLWCNYNLVWYVFSEQNKFDYYETQRVIKDVTEKYTNWGSVTPHFEYTIECLWWKNKPSKYELLKLIGMEDDYKQKQKEIKQKSYNDKIDKFVKEYNQWNNGGYKKPSEKSVLEFFQNNNEDYNQDKKLQKDVLNKLKYIYENYYN